MAKILVNDGISADGERILRDAGHELEMTKVEQPRLRDELPNYDAILVRSATKVRREHIEASPELKLIGRGGVGLDNIDVEFAKSKGIEVINTPAASSDSVAELTLGHMFSLARFIHAANVTMRNGEWNKKQYKGIELNGKTLGIIGFGRIGRALAKRAIALGMRVMAYDVITIETDLNVQVVGLDDLLAHSDFVSVHVPGKHAFEMKADQFKKMKDGAYVLNCARGGVLNESALLEALNSEKLAGAALDTYDNEPEPMKELITHPRVSVTPHIGASTKEGQDRVGLELASKVKEFFAG